MFEDLTGKKPFHFDNPIKHVTHEISDTVHQVEDKIKEEVTHIQSEVKEEIVDIEEKIVEGADNLKKEAEKVEDKVEDWVENQRDKVVDKFHTITDNLRAPLQSFEGMLMIGGVAVAILLYKSYQSAKEVARDPRIQKMAYQLADDALKAKTQS